MTFTNPPLNCAVSLKPIVGIKRHADEPKNAPGQKRPCTIAREDGVEFEVHNHAAIPRYSVTGTPPKCPPLQIYDSGNEYHRWQTSCGLQYIDSDGHIMRPVNVSTASTFSKTDISLLEQLIQYSMVSETKHTTNVSLPATSTRLAAPAATTLDHSTSSESIHPSKPLPQSSSTRPNTTNGVSQASHSSSIQDLHYRTTMKHGTTMGSSPNISARPPAASRTTVNRTTSPERITSCESSSQLTLPQSNFAHGIKQTTGASSRPDSTYQSNAKQSTEHKRQRMDSVIASGGTRLTPPYPSKPNMNTTTEAPRSSTMTSATVEAADVRPTDARRLENWPLTPRNTKPWATSQQQRVLSGKVIDLIQDSPESGKVGSSSQSKISKRFSAASPALERQRIASNQTPHIIEQQHLHYPYVPKALHNDNRTNDASMHPSQVYGPKPQSVHSNAHQTPIAPLKQATASRPNGTPSSVPSQSSALNTPLLREIRTSDSDGSNQARAIRFIQKHPHLDRGFYATPKDIDLALRLAKQEGYFELPQGTGDLLRDHEAPRPEAEHMLACAIRFAKSPDQMRTPWRNHPQDLGQILRQYLDHTGSRQLRWMNPDPGSCGPQLAPIIRFVRKARFNHNQWGVNDIPHINRLMKEHEAQERAMIASRRIR